MNSHSLEDAATGLGWKHCKHVTSWASCHSCCFQNLSGKFTMTGRGSDQDRLRENESGWMPFDRWRNTMTGRGKYNDIVWESPHTVGQWAHFSLEALHSDFTPRQQTQIHPCVSHLSDTFLIHSYYISMQWLEGDIWYGCVMVRWTMICIN